MPSINDVVEMAELLRSRSVVAAEDRCISVRNRNAKCSKCVDACIAGAIEVALNKLTIDPGACVGCGACVAVCPTEALVSLDPLQEDLAASIAKALGQSEGIAAIACARMASKQIGDPEKFAVVPCLGRVDEETIVSLAARGVKDIVLVDGTCETCKYGKVSPLVDEAMETAIRLLEALGSDAVVTRDSAFPPEIVAQDDRKVVGASRRRFFSNAGGYAKSAAMTVAEKAVDDALNQSREKKLLTLRDRLGAGKSGRLPTFTADRNMRIMDDLWRLAEAAEERGGAVPGEAGGDPEALGGTEGAAPAFDEEAVIDTRLFGAMDIDPEKCSGCGMCVMFCPTGALAYSTLEEPESDEMRYLEFQASDCTQCCLCTDVCLRRCMTLSSKVRLADLFDFEPQLIEIPKPPKASSILARHHGRSAK